MKSISAAIIVAAGAALVYGSMFLAACYKPFNDAGVAAIAGGVIAIAGLVGWFHTLRLKD